MKIILGLIILICLGCSSKPKTVAVNPPTKLCVGNKPTMKLTATFAVSQDIAQGTELKYLDEKLNRYNEIADMASVRFFEFLSHTNGSRVRVEVLDHNKIHIVRVSDKPLLFVICKEETCAGLKEPFSGNEIKATTYENEYTRRVNLFYVQDKYASSIWFSPSENLDYANDPFTSAAQALNVNLADFMQANYFEDQKAEDLLRNVTINKKVQGNWKIQQVTLDPKEICENARPKSDLYSN